MIEQAINDNPIIGINVNEYLLFKIAFPVIPLFKKINPPKSAMTAKEVVTLFCLKKSLPFFMF